MAQGKAHRHPEGVSPVLMPSLLGVQQQGQAKRMQRQRGESQAVVVVGVGNENKATAAMPQALSLKTGAVQQTHLLL